MIPYQWFKCRSDKVWRMINDIHEFIWMNIHEWCLFHAFKTFTFLQILTNFISIHPATNSFHCMHMRFARIMNIVIITIILFDCWMVLSLSNQWYRNLRLKMLSQQHELNLTKSLLHSFRQPVCQLINTVGI